MGGDHVRPWSAALTGPMRNTDLHLVRQLCEGRAGIEIYTPHGDAALVLTQPAVASTPQSSEVVLKIQEVEEELFTPLSCSRRAPGVVYFTRSRGCEHRDLPDRDDYQFSSIISAR